MRGNVSVHIPSVSMKEVILFLSCLCILGPGALVAGQLDLKETC